MNDLFGFFKKNAYDNHYVSLTKALNSAHTTAETRKTIKPFTEQIENGTAHAGALVIHKDICYTTYLHNYGARDDNPYSGTLVLELAMFSLKRALADDFDFKKDVDVIVLDKDEAITGGIEATSTYVANSLCMIGDVLHITFGARLKEGKYQHYHVTYDTESKVFSHAKETMLRYKDELYLMDDIHISKISTKEGYGCNANGFPQTTNRWSEYKGYYYTTFIIDGVGVKRPMVIKTKDFDTMEFVSMIPDGEYTAAEIASCIHTDQLYIAHRQKWTMPYMIVNRYDLETGTWLESYKIESGTSRPWFFIHHDEVYLYNTIEEQKRRYANISKVRTSREAHNHKTVPMDTVATIFDCGSYHSFYVYEDRIFFVCTMYGTMRFGELVLKEYDATKVNEKLIEIFGE